VCKTETTNAWVASSELKYQIYNNKNKEDQRDYNLKICVSNHEQYGIGIYFEP